MAVDVEPDTRPVKSRGRRAVFWTGIALIAVGLTILGYFAWEFFGTNIVARQKQAQNIEELTKQWEAPSGPTAEKGDVPLGEASALVRIPRFGSSYEMPVLEGTSDESLSQGFAHFEHSAGPGAIGNYALAAHRVTHGEPLRHMPDLRPGDEVLVETRRAIYTYVLDTDPRDLTVRFSDTWVVDPAPVNPDGGVGPASAQDRLITLTTCSEIFHTDDRMIAFGHLTSVERK